MENTLVVNRDNPGVGFVTAVSTTAPRLHRLELVVPEGDHPVKIIQDGRDKAI